jgi:hypothetical protein
MWNIQGRESIELDGSPTECRPNKLCIPDAIYRESIGTVLGINSGDYPRALPFLFQMS